MSDSEKDEGLANPDLLPAYTESLASFHREFLPELSANVRALPLGKSTRALDAGCGDGFYTQLLADRVGENGSALGIDANRALLARARKDVGGRTNLLFQELTLSALGQQPTRYDLIWCAQSLFSFGNEYRAVVTLAKQLAPGGLLAVLENDYLHQLLLPWPADVELLLRQAELRTLEHQTSNPERYYVGRRLPKLLAQSGLVDVHFQTQAIDRAAPLSDDLCHFLEDYLDALLERATPVLTPTELARVTDVLHRDQRQTLLTEPQLSLTWVNTLAWGRRPN